MSKRLLQPGERIRVLVVDDSVVIRRLVTHALEEDPALEVVGAASNGVIALERIPQFNPDIITLDVEMPEMDGLEALRHIRRDFPGIRVIMFSTLTDRGAAVTLEALTLGADDYVTKASNEGSLDRSMARLREELIPKIKQFFQLPDHAPAVLPKAPTPAWRSMKVRPRVVVIGVSTGGPAALGAILPQLPSTFPLPVLIVQHMPPLFTRLLAERLGSICQLAVAEAGQGDPVEAGRILIAPGDFHLKVASNGRGVRVYLDQSPPQNSCRPAADALFSSIGELYGGAVIAVVLTGMGQDGLHGAKILKAQGASVLAQDEASSVVWGMPGAVVNAGLADRVLPLDLVVPEILLRAGSLERIQMESPTSGAEIHPDNYRFLQEHVYTHVGIVLEEDKHYLFESRLAPIVRQLGLGSINDLCALLRATREAEPSRQVVEAMTTNETYFFRDPAHYDAIRNVLLPRLKEERRDTKRLRFWSAAASTGQEAYSLAMLLIQEGMTDWSIEILGTDYASSVVERAKSGNYQQIEVNRGLPATLLVKHFRRSGTDWQLSDAVRRMVHFETLDLRKSMRSLGPFDLVFCRNVMIYFDAETKRSMFQELHGTLFRGGWLLLGGAETAFGAETWFEKQTVANAVVHVAR